MNVEMVMEDAVRGVLTLLVLSHAPVNRASHWMEMEGHAQVSQLA